MDKIESEENQQQRLHQPSEQRPVTSRGGSKHPYSIAQIIKPQDDSSCVVNDNIAASSTPEEESHEASRGSVQYGTPEVARRDAPASEPEVESNIAHSPLLVVDKDSPVKEGTLDSSQDAALDASRDASRSNAYDAVNDTG